MTQQTLVRKSKNKEILLNELTEISLNFENLQEFLDETTDKISETMGLKRIFILINEFYAGKILTAHSFPNEKDPEFISKFWRKQLEGNKQLINIEDIENSTLPGEIKNFYREIGIKKILAKNLCIEKECFGGISFEFNDEEETDLETIDMIYSIISQLYLLLERYRFSQYRKKQLEKDKLINNIVAGIKASIDVDEIEQIIVNGIGKYLNAERIFILKFNKEINKFFPVKNEYLASNNLKSRIGYDLPEDLPHFNELFMNKKDVWINDCGYYIKKLKLEGSKLDEYRKYFQINSTFRVPIINNGELIGGISGHSTKKDAFSKDDIDFVKMIASHVSVAIYKARLLQQEKQIARREYLLRRIIEATTSVPGDTENVRKTIITEIGKATGADRCYFGTLDKISKTINRANVEYKSSSDVKSVISAAFTTEMVECLITYLNNNKNEKKVLIDDTEKYLKDYKLIGSDMEKHLKEYKIKSCYFFPVTNNESITKYLILNYTKKPVSFSEEEIELLETLAAQIATAITHSKMYDDNKKQAQREKLLREVMQSIRTSFDIYEIKNHFVNLLGIYFKADRIGVSQFDEKRKVFLPFDKSSEYLYSSDQFSFVGYCWNNKEIKPFITPLLEGKEVNFSDLNVYIKENNLEKTRLPELFKKANIKSSYNVPILYGEKILGYFCVDFSNKVYLGKEDLNLLRMLADQAGLAFHQANLAERSQKNIQRAKLLSEIITMVKGTLDVNEFVTLLYRQFKEFYKIEEVFACSHFISNYKAFYGSDLNEKVKDEDLKKLGKYLCEKTKGIEKVSIETLTKKHFDELGVKQAVILPIKLKDFKLGHFYLLFKENKIWEEEDIGLLEKITDNITIAIRDFGLYTKSNFMADVSHELKTPVAIIDAYANNLLNRGDYSPDEVEKYLGTIKQNTIRITNIIENLMTLSKLEQDTTKKIIKAEEIDIKTVINNVINIQSSIAEEKNITFKIDCSGGIKLKANEVLMEQALLNLLKNAVQYSYKGSQIIIGAKKTDVDLRLSVQDFGCGLTPQHIKDIFKRFYRVDKSRSRQTGGSGLGLSIVEKISELYNGKIEVESEPEKGSIFTIIIPQK